MQSERKERLKYRAPMPVTADDAASAIVRQLASLCKAFPGAWVRQENGVAALYTGLPAPMFNGVIAERNDADADFAKRILDEFAEAGVPYNVSVRSSDYVAFIELAKERGLTQARTVPLMVLESPSGDEPLPKGLSIRKLVPDESEKSAEIAAACFEMPVEIARQMTRQEVLELDGLRCYLGEFDGRPVATSLGITSAGVVGIFNVATLKEARGRGFGRALTVRAIAEGVAGGATWAYLQSSAAGFSIYRALGFETVEEWSEYLPAQPDAS